MIKEQLKKMLDNGAKLDDIIIALIETLDEVINVENRRLVKCQFISSAINKLNEQVNLIKEQHQMGVHIDIDNETPDNDLVSLIQADADTDFNELEREIETLGLEDDIQLELEVIAQEEKNGSADVNSRSEFISNLSSVYEGFEIDGRPENATFALYTSTTIN
jgi:hypothetical protein